MSRHIAVFVLVTFFAAGCGSDPGGLDAVAVPSGDAPSADDDVCDSVPAVTPELRPVGVVIELSNNGADHVSCDGGFDQSPPASGNHFDGWQNCGFYNSPIRDYTAVHSLEHGAVWIAFQPDLDAATVAEIAGRTEGESHLLAAPYPGLANPIVLTAWTRQLAVDDWSDPAVESFIDSFNGSSSSTAPEAGASCEGVVGSAPDEPDANYAAILGQVTGG